MEGSVLLHKNRNGWTQEGGRGRETCNCEENWGCTCKIACDLTRGRARGSDNSTDAALSSDELPHRRESLLRTAARIFPAVLHRHTTEQFVVIIHILNSKFGRTNELVARSCTSCQQNNDATARARVCEESLATRMEGTKLR